MSNSAKKKTLGELNPGAQARIFSVGEKGDCPLDLARRFLEMGLLEGAVIEVLHQAPFGGDPLAIRVRGSIIALRRNEANHIEVDEVAAPNVEKAAEQVAEEAV